MNTNSSDQNGDNKINLAVGVVTLQYEKECVDALLGVIHAHMCIGYVAVGATLLPFGRNVCIKEFYEKAPEFTHLIFIDDDMCNFGPQHIHELVIADKPIISALVTSRHPRYEIVAVFEDNEFDAVKGYIERREIVESRHVGMAFTVIKREVLDAVSETIEDGSRIWFTTDRQPRDTFEVEVKEFIASKRKQHEKSDFSFDNTIRDAIVFGQMSHIGSTLLGEDVTFCARAANLGFKSYVHCGVAVGHISHTSRDFRDTFIHSQQIARPRVITNV